MKNLKLYSLLFVAVLLLSACGDKKKANVKRDPVKITVDASADHIRGNKSASVSLVEYSDFECPFCRQHHPTIKKLLAKYGTKVNWVYRHYPLAFIHKNAMQAAEATECAKEQGGNNAFWSFSDMLFEKGVDPSRYDDYAKSLSLDANKLIACVESGKYTDKVKAQMKQGQSYYVKSTPTTFVVNNKTRDAKAFAGLQPAENFEEYIDSLLK